MMAMAARGRPEPLRVSVVVPALDEEAALPGVVENLEAQQAPPWFEAILADGGSRDRTVDLFRRLTSRWPPEARAARVITTPRPGRSIQMNAGARAAAGEVLLFLHADTRLPAAALRAVAEALADEATAGGGFRHRFSEPKLSLRLISAWATLRSRLCGIHYGDQAIFVRRSVFEAVGGFPEVALFEDLRLARAIRAAGRVRTLPLAAETSARRLLRQGVPRAAAQFAWLKLRHALGADPERLKARYPDVR